jgi:hypothetical protein
MTLETWRGSVLLGWLDGFYASFCALKGRLAPANPAARVVYFRVSVGQDPCPCLAQNPPALHIAESLYCPSLRATAKAEDLPRSPTAVATPLRLEMRRDAGVDGHGPS